MTQLDPRIAMHTMGAVDSRAWVLRDPDKNQSCFYWFHVTWSPGVLTLSGDCGDLTLTHPQALKTWEAGAYWLSGACYRYAMEKSEVRKVYHPEDTMEYLFGMIDEQIEDGDLTWWNVLGSRAVGGWVGEGIPVTNENRHKVVADAMLFGLSQDFLYDSLDGFDGEDFVYDYPKEYEFRFECLKKWAEMIVAQLEKAKAEGGSAEE